MVHSGGGETAKGRDFREEKGLCTAAQPHSAPTQVATFPAAGPISHPSVSVCKGLGRSQRPHCGAAEGVCPTLTRSPSKGNRQRDKEKPPPRLTGRTKASLGACSRGSDCTPGSISARQGSSDKKPMNCHFRKMRTEAYAFTYVCICIPTRFFYILMIPQVLSQVPSETLPRLRDAHKRRAVCSAGSVLGQAGARLRLQRQPGVRSWLLGAA